MTVKLKRIYDEPAKSDGFRILVDRLWPRGVSKEKAAVNLWLKEIAPSTELRKWFAHDTEKWPEFQIRYRRELDANDAAVETLVSHAGKGNITLLFAARDSEHNEAVVLKKFLEENS